MKKVLSLVLALALVLGCASFATAEDAKIKLVVYSFTNELQGMIEKYYAPNHPEIEFDFQIYPTDGNAYTDGHTDTYTYRYARAHTDSHSGTDSYAYS